MLKKSMIAVIPLVMILIYLAPLWTLRLTETEFPELSFPENIEKKALVIVAHDDDACAVTGLIHKLVSSGWQVDFATFYQDEHNGYRGEDIPLRKKELETFARQIGITNVYQTTFQMRKGTFDTIPEPYMPVAHDNMHHTFEVDSLKAYLETYIQKSSPSIIISLDDKMGGYGHPEHVLVSKTITEICFEKRGSSNFPVKYYCQSVFSDSQEKALVQFPVYRKAKEVYGVDGMPPPNARLSLNNHTKMKRFGLSVWKSQQRNIRKFFPYFQFYPHWIYFKVINQEYYHVLTF
jgi:LmbE family N-acetylglucosaminyl deacetylase